MGMGVAVMVPVVVGMVVRHGRTLYYNITGVHALTRVIGLHSRGRSPEVCFDFHPLKRGRREDRVRAAPAVSRAKGNR